MANDDLLQNIHLPAANTDAEKIALANEEQRLTRDLGDAGNNSANTTLIFNKLCLITIRPPSTKQQEKLSYAEIKIIRARERKRWKNDRLLAAKTNASEIRSDDQHRPIDDASNENDESKDVQEERKLNETFSNFVVASLERVKDPRRRKTLLKDVMNILYAE